MSKEKQAIYLDYNATAKLRPEVIALMGAVLAETGNASSIHSFGRTARAHVETAREQLAELTGTQPTAVTFTSGATESNNAVLHAFSDGPIWISAIEHPSVREAAPEALKIPVTANGVIDRAAFEKMVEESPAPALISMMLVNNETGAVQPVAELARLAKQKYKDVFIHIDAAQAAGRIKIDFPALQADYMSLSAHKLGGPQGVGALITAPGARPAKLLYGGSQEKRQRAGTENVAGIAGFGLAAKLALDGLDDYQNLAPWRDAMENSLRKNCKNLHIYSQKEPRVANTSMIGLPGLTADTQIMALDMAGIAVSSGAACSSGTLKPSPVLLAMGADEKEAACALRISGGWDTKEDDFKRFADAWLALYDRVKGKLE